MFIYLLYAETWVFCVILSFKSTFLIDHELTYIHVVPSVQVKIMMAVHNAQKLKLKLYTLD